MTEISANVEDFNYAIDNVRYLVAPFDEKAIIYTCECASCHSSNRYKHLIPWYSLGGFLIPIFWLASFIFYLKFQWIADHEPDHRLLSMQDYPTDYEADKCFQRSYFEVDRETTNCIHQLNDRPKIAKTCNPEGCVDMEALPRDNTTEYITQIAQDIVAYHEHLRAIYRKWTIIALLGVMFYSLVISILINAAIH